MWLCDCGAEVIRLMTRRAVSHHACRLRVTGIAGICVRVAGDCLTFIERCARVRRRERTRRKGFRTPTRGGPHGRADDDYAPDEEGYGPSATQVKRRLPKETCFTGRTRPLRVEQGRRSIL